MGMGVERSATRLTRRTAAMSSSVPTVAWIEVDSGNRRRTGG